jgi:hypothetical protein
MGFDGFRNPPVGAQGVITRPVFKSDNYIPGQAGWAIFKNGNAEFNALGGSFQITGQGIFFYVPTAGVGNLFASFASVGGVDPYGNQFNGGVFVNQHQGWFTGDNSHTVTINANGATGPQLLFTVAGNPSMVEIIGDQSGGDNRLLIQDTGGSGSRLEANLPFIATGGYQGVNTAQGAQPTFASTGVFVEYPSASWTPLTLLCPPSESIVINTNAFGYNNVTDNSTLSISPKIKQGATLLQNPQQGQSGPSIRSPGLGAVQNVQGFVSYVLGQDVLGGHAGQTLTIIPCWRISSGSAASSNVNFASMTSYPLPYTVPQSG